jgi:uncharacterized protein
MTRVKFYQDQDGQCTGFEVSGHSGYGDEGTDIICASISALTVNAINSLEELVEDPVRVEADEEEAYLKLSIAGDHSAEADILLRSLQMGMSNMYSNETVKQYMDLIFEEV